MYLRQNAVPWANAPDRTSERCPLMKLPTIKEMLGTLVSTPSVSCTSDAQDQSNLDVIDHLATWLEDLGGTVERMPLPENAAKANLIATFGPPGEGEREGNGLALSGHTDTVPCDEARWSRDPFALAESEDRLYGLGACDMKGFFPVALTALAGFRDTRFVRPLTIVATSDEESSMAGARYLAESGRPKARAAVIGEPTGLRPIHAHKGFMMLSIKLRGSSGHSSNPDLGNNALDAMHAVMGELIAYRGELAAAFQNPAFAVPTPTLNLGCLHAGDNPNRICEGAELQIDLRLIPGMDHTGVRAEMDTRLGAIAAERNIGIDIAPVFPPVPSYETPPDGELVRALEQLSGRSSGSVAFGTEAPFFQALGMETVIFGPGSIDQAHQPDEYLETSNIRPAVDVLTGLIGRYCVDA